MLPLDLQSLRKHLPALGVFITPVLLVKLAAFSVAEPGPAEHAAHVQTVSAPAPQPQQTRKATETERAAAARIAELRTQPFGTTPLYYAGSATAYVPQEPVIEDGPTPEADDSLNVIIRAVMSTRDASTGTASSIAIINGRQRRVGDVIAQWKIIAISTADRTVTFEHSETGERESRAVLGP